MKLKNIIVSLSLISLLASCSNGTTTPVPTTPSDNSSNTGDSDYQPVGELQRLMKEIKKDSNSIKRLNPKQSGYTMPVI